MSDHGTTPMPRNHVWEHRWGVILAGGEGVRLRSLTRLIAGDDRPKQFCPLLGGRTLLAQTRQRIARRISHNRALFVLLKAHESFYADELADVSAAQKLVQPSNRGTLPAILWSLLQIVELDPRAAVAFFPSDHYYTDEGNFMAGTALAFGAAESNRDSVILLAAPAMHPETEYGWIEAEAAPSCQLENGLLRVKHFWEKPSQEVATDLLDRGCVWNTFVMVGLATAFLRLIRSSAPEVYHAFASMYRQRDPDIEAELMSSLYADLPTVDLSKRVLAMAPEMLRVLCLGDVGWSDLGSPQRVVEVARRTGEKNDWLDLWHRDAMWATSSRDTDPVDRSARSASVA